MISALLRLFRPDHVHAYVVVAWLTEGDIPLRLSACSHPGCTATVMYVA